MEEGTDKSNKAYQARRKAEEIRRKENERSSGRGK
jgi:hypothetical protein